MNKWLFTILRGALDAASPEIVENLRQLVQEMVVKAKATPNPWDDVFTGLLQLIVGKPGARKLSSIEEE